MNNLAAEKLFNSNIIDEIFDYHEKNPKKRFFHYDANLETLQIVKSKTESLEDIKKIYYSNEQTKEKFASMIKSAPQNLPKGLIVISVIFHDKDKDCSFIAWYMQSIWEDRFKIILGVPQVSFDSNLFATKEESLKIFKSYDLAKVCLTMARNREIWSVNVLIHSRIVGEDLQYKVPNMYFMDVKIFIIIMRRLLYPVEEITKLKKYFNRYGVDLLVFNLRIKLEDYLLFFKIEDGRFILLD